MRVRIAFVFDFLQEICKEYCKFTWRICCSWLGMGWHSFWVLGDCGEIPVIQLSLSFCSLSRQVRRRPLLRICLGERKA